MTSDGKQVLFDRKGNRVLIDNPQWDPEAGEDDPDSNQIAAAYEFQPRPALKALDQLGRHIGYYAANDNNKQPMVGASIAIKFVDAAPADE